MRDPSGEAAATTAEAAAKMGCNEELCSSRVTGSCSHSDAAGDAGTHVCSRYSEGWDVPAAEVPTTASAGRYLLPQHCYLLCSSMLAHHCVIIYISTGSSNMHATAPAAVI
jgi:hypothetical protein